MNTITNFVAGLKAHLQSKDTSYGESPYLYQGFCGSDVTAGDPVEVDWRALNKEIDAFCAEFKTKREA